jgi:hypothetical protein
MVGLLILLPLFFAALFAGIEILVLGLGIAALTLLALALVGAWWPKASGRWRRYGRWWM